MSMLEHYVGVKKSNVLFLTLLVNKSVSLFLVPYVYFLYLIVNHKHGKRR